MEIHYAHFPLKRARHPSEYFDSLFPELMERIRLNYVSPTKPSFLLNFAPFAEHEWAQTVRHNIRVARRHLGHAASSY